MHHKKRILAALMAFSFVFSACVSKKKYDEAQEENRDLREQLTRDNENAQKEMTQLNAEIDDLKKQKTALEDELIACKHNAEGLENERKMLDDFAKDLQEQLKNTISGSNLEKNKLMGSLDNYKQMLQDKEKKLAALSQDLEMRERDLKNLHKELAAREAKLKELEALLAQKEAYIQKMRKNLDNLLEEFKDKGLSIELIHGRIYIRLAASLLFQSGRTEVDEQGKQAIISLAKAIQNEHDIQILVEGHTDDVPLKSATTPKDNWELSVLRATSVVAIMLQHSKISSKIITAAGRAEFMPVSTTNKNLNRRIEVILIPNLDKIMEAVKS